MDVLLYLIPIALTLGVAGLYGFFWASRHGQFDDLDAASYRALHDEEGAFDMHQGTAPKDD
jgi:cbb3-type cytochrome oxidase maturation protein